MRKCDLKYFGSIFVNMPSVWIFLQSRSKTLDCMCSQLTENIAYFLSLSLSLFSEHTHRCCLLQSELPDFLFSSPSMQTVCVCWFVSVHLCIRRVVLSLSLSCFVLFIPLLSALLPNSEDQGLMCCNRSRSRFVVRLCVPDVNEQLCHLSV